jgi:uncharacterized membrane protein
MNKPAMEQKPELRALLWPLIIMLAGYALGIMLILDIYSPARTILSLGFMLICPGMAFVRLLRIEDPITELTLALALSISLDMFVSEAMVLSRHWLPVWGSIILIVIALIGASIQLGQYIHARRRYLQKAGHR